MPTDEVTIYTDGSCHTQQRIGAWVAIVFMAGEKIVLSGKETDTTHNRMELTAVIKAVNYIQEQLPDIKALTIVTDSQYVVGIADRKHKLLSVDFITKKGKELPNTDLVRDLIALETALTINFIKIKAHQKQSGAPNYNIEADKLSRKMVRDAINATQHDPI